MGTPDEEVWNGVSTLPDYKPTFPRWPRRATWVQRTCPTLDPLGCDLLSKMLAYQPNKRISARAALEHPCEFLRRSRALTLSSIRLSCKAATSPLCTCNGCTCARPMHVHMRPTIPPPPPSRVCGLGQEQPIVQCLPRTDAGGGVESPLCLSKGCTYYRPISDAKNPSGCPRVARSMGLRPAAAGPGSPAAAAPSDSVCRPLFFASAAAFRSLVETLYCV